MAGVLTCTSFESPKSNFIHHLIFRMLCSRLPLSLVMSSSYMMLYLVSLNLSVTGPFLSHSHLATAVSVSHFLSFIRSPQPKWLLDRPQRGPTSTSIHPLTFLIRSQSGAKMMPGTAHPTRSRPQTRSPSGVVRTTSPPILACRARRPRQ